MQTQYVVDAAGADVVNPKFPLKVMAWPILRLWPADIVNNGDDHELIVRAAADTTVPATRTVWPMPNPCAAAVVTVKEDAVDVILVVTASGLANVATVDDGTEATTRTPWKKAGVVS